MRRKRQSGPCWDAVSRIFNWGQISNSPRDGSARNGHNQNDPSLPPALLLHQVD